jgi:ATP-dependent Clp protease ATP-binding subunit ClpA
LDIPIGKINEQAQRVFDRAVSEAQRRGHDELTSAHLFLGFAQVEWDVFVDIIGDFMPNPHALVLDVEEALATLPSVERAVLRIPHSTRLLAKLALRRANKDGRHALGPKDLFGAVLEEAHGLPVAILRRYSVDPSAGWTRRQCAPRWIAGGRCGPKMSCRSSLTLPRSQRTWCVAM